MGRRQKILLPRRVGRGSDRGRPFLCSSIKNVTRNISVEPVDIHRFVDKNENILNGLVQRTLKDLYTDRCYGSIISARNPFDEKTLQGKIMKAFSENSYHSLSFRFRRPCVRAARLKRKAESGRLLFSSTLFSVILNIFRIFLCFRYFSHKKSTFYQ